MRYMYEWQHWWLYSGVVSGICLYVYVSVAGFFCWLAYTLKFSLFLYGFYKRGRGVKDR